jgi:hypothetical protein
MSLREIKPNGASPPAPQDTSSQVGSKNARTLDVAAKWAPPPLPRHAGYRDLVGDSAPPRSARDASRRRLLALADMLALGLALLATGLASGGARATYPMLALLPLWLALGKLIGLHDRDAHRVRVRAMARYLGHGEELKFPTRFDRCNARAIAMMLDEWEPSEIVSYFRGAPYFSMSRPLQRLYLGYENLIESRSVDALATHYLIIARAP